MPRKIKGKGDGFMKKEDLVQGIILGDSYMKSRFRPLTIEDPKVLLPVGGCAMINYTLELLSSVCNEIFVICSSNSEKLEDYIFHSKWNNKKLYPNLNIIIVNVPYCNNIGHVLKHIQKNEKSKIKTDPFILMRGDVITNIDLNSLINKHKQRHKIDNNNILTCVFKKADPKQRTRYIFF